MQSLGVKTIGVSAAYFLSLHGPRFSPEDVAGELEGLKSRGFDAVQLEVFDSSVLSRWVEGGMALVAGEARRRQIRVSAFVAHFLGDRLSSPVSRNQGDGKDPFEVVLDLMDLLPPSVPLALPLLPCGMVPGELKAEALKLLSLWADRAAERGRRLVLEIVPGSVAGTYTAFLADPFWRDLAAKTGLLLDTGHAHVMGEDLPALVLRLEGRLAALHLSDNDGRENRSDAPGDGLVDWRLFMDALTAIGFEGSLDLEISGPVELLREKYRKGREYLLNLPEGANLKRGKRNEIAV